MCDFRVNNSASAPKSQIVKDAEINHALSFLTRNSLNEKSDQRVNEVQRVEGYLGGGVCDLVIVAGTTATFGYIVDWALRAIASDGELVDVNPEETPLSQFATQRVRERAALALPRIVDELVISRSSKL